MRANKEYYSLECSTTLLDTKRLQFEWYLNATLISSSDPDFEQVLHQPLSQYPGAIYSTELIFKKATTKLNGVYTCSLIYKGENMNITKKETFIYRSKDGPHYQVFKEKFVEKSSGESWEEVCSAEGWPLPKVDWYRNGQLIAANESDVNDDVPTVITHHRHLNISARLIIKNISQNNIGRYSCMINGQISFKNVTLKFSKINGKTDDESKTGKANK